MPSCFVIMPFGDKELEINRKPRRKLQIDFDAVYRDLIKSTAESLGLRVQRSDEANLSGSVQKEMINLIFDADVCIVDLTTLNANVFYELGVRHALRRGVTVMIKHELSSMPFNIAGFSAIDYTLDDFTAARDTISKYIRNGLERRHVDSLVFDSIQQLTVSTGPEKPITQPRNIRYPLKDRDRHAIGLIGGDLRDIHGIQVWVNSENTNMQMARSYDRSISSTIRFLGAEKDEHDNILRDVIAEELARKVGSTRAVGPAKVYATPSGALKASNDVDLVMHVAAVEGREPGGGYKRVENIRQCVTNVLTELARNEALAAPSVLFPLLGTGMGAGKAEDVVPQLIEAAMTFLDRHRSADIDTVWFLAYTESQWQLCEREVQRYAAKLGEPAPWDPPERKWK